MLLAEGEFFAHVHRIVALAGGGIQVHQVRYVAPELARYGLALGSVAVQASLHQQVVFFAFSGERVQQGLAHNSN